MSKNILLINGPNLNLLGSRETDVYGKRTLSDIEKQTENFFSEKGMDLITFQSNHEGELVDFIQKRRDASYIIFNPGAFTHTSIAIRDALLGTEVPFIEVHISNIFARETFRHHSYLSDVSKGVIAGCGIQGYNLAAQLIASRI